MKIIIKETLIFGTKEKGILEKVDIMLIVKYWVKYEVK